MCVTFQTNEKNPRRMLDRMGRCKKLPVSAFNPLWSPSPGFRGFLHKQALGLRCLLGGGPGSDSAGERAAGGHPAGESKGDSFSSLVLKQNADQLAALPLPRISLKTSFYDHLDKAPGCTAFWSIHFQARFPNISGGST